MGLRMGPNRRVIYESPKTGQVEVSEGLKKPAGLRIHKDRSVEEAGRLVLPEDAALALRDYLNERYGSGPRPAAYEAGPIPGALF